MANLGIFGGSFDPVHVGHLILAEQAAEQLALDEVWWVPAARPPHKQGRPITQVADRVTLLRLALTGRPGWSVHDLESGRDGASYTVDTLREVRRRRPEDRLFFLMGADSLRDLPTWRDPDGIAGLATIAAVNRGFGTAEVPESLSDVVRGRVRVLEMPACGISASDVRARAAAGRSVRYLVPRAVELAIADHGLYAG